MPTPKKKHPSDCICSNGCLPEFMAAVDKAYKRIIPEEIRRRERFIGFVPFIGMKRVKQAKSVED